MVIFDLDKLVEDTNLYEKMVELHVGQIVKGVVACNFKEFSFVKVANLSCILPLSEISFDTKQKCLKIGTEIEAVVIKMSEEHGIMLSIKRIKGDPWQTIEEDYKIGQRVNVKVKNIASYGVFVEFGAGLSGLVHRNNLTIQKHVEPKDIVSVGQMIEVQILSIDKERKRIALSLKDCMEDPWEHVEERYHIGQKLSRKIINLLGYGAFFELEPGVEALLHRSELGLTKADKLKKYLSVGDVLEVEIATLDVENRKISLKGNLPTKSDDNTIESDE